MGGDSDEEEEVILEPQAKLLAGLPKIEVRKNELRQDLFIKLQSLTAKALDTNKLQKDAAHHIKQELDKDVEFNELIGKGPWQVIVGRSYAAAITHESMHVSFFDIPKYQETVLIYKSLGVQSV